MPQAVGTTGSTVEGDGDLEVVDAAMLAPQGGVSQDDQVQDAKIASGGQHGLGWGGDPEPIEPLACYGLGMTADQKSASSWARDTVARGGEDRVRDWRWLPPPQKLGNCQVSERGGGRQDKLPGPQFLGQGADPSRCVQAVTDAFPLALADVASEGPGQCRHVWRMWIRKVSMPDPAGSVDDATRGHLLWTNTGH